MYYTTEDLGDIIGIANNAFFKLNFDFKIKNDIGYIIAKYLIIEWVSV